MISALTCAFAQWSPEIGDNHPVGWLTVCAYLAACLMSARAAFALGGRDVLDRRERGFWIIAAVLFACLALNKQLDLQSLVTATGRCHAELHGWYDKRDRVQLWFVLLTGAVGLAGLLGLIVVLRGVASRVWLAILGLGFVSVFVLVRAVSFHQIDAFLGHELFGLRANWLLELPGPILVFLVALRRAGGK